jgi:hypothetical protein
MTARLARERKIGNAFDKKTPKNTGFSLLSGF